MINPQLVDEQIRGGVVQGIGGALFEHCLYDERGQLLNGNMADYLVPMAAEMPDIEVGHVVTPTADSELGAKGAGEAGTAGAPGAVMNAINDALRPLGATPLTDMPFTPERDSAGAWPSLTVCMDEGWRADRRQPAGRSRPRASIATGRPVLRCDRLRARSVEQCMGKGRPMDIKVGKQAIEEATKKLTNWGRWGKDDQIGTLNHVTPEDIVKAASLIRTGKVFALGIPLDRDGPQTGLFGGRFNPIHQMLATGTDAIAGRQDWNKIRYADDTLMLCVQGATHWDALGHIFYEDKAYNGHDAKLIDAKGLNVLGIEHSKSKMVGRGVLLDIARFRGVDWLQDGESISNDELDKCAKDQNVAIGRGDFVIVRTGQMERCLKEKKWGGYAGGDAPGVKFENCYWCQDKQIAAICTDTWGVEVRPNETTEANQPWHWVVIPAMGLCMGEIFYLKELAEDCDADGIYEFFFCGPPLIITGGTGSPINPQAIK